ncbi:MAG: pyrimidine/purine nucleoside phosphorylase [Cyclobacteriaceae bacterium]
MISNNEYFNGTVKSLGYSSAEGNSTIGVMEPGEYEFDTSFYEKMVVIEGKLEVQYPGEDSWTTYGNGSSFEVEANSSFKIKSIGQTSYLCKYE